MKCRRSIPSGEKPPSQMSSSGEHISVPPLTLPQRTSDKSIKEAKSKRKRKECCTLAGKVPRKHLRGKVPQMEEDAKRCPHRYHPRMLALQEILPYQNSTDLYIERAPFYQLVREIIQHHLVYGQVPRFHVDGLAEYYFLSLVDDANLCAIHAK